MKTKKIPGGFYGGHRKNLFCCPRGGERSRMPMDLQFNPRGKAVVVSLAGRLDAHGALEAEQGLADIGKGPEMVVLDLDKVPYLSSAGVRLFVALHKTLQARGGKLFLARLQPYCLEVIKVTGLASVLNIRKDLDEALAEAGPEARQWRSNGGRFAFHPGSDKSGGIEVLGKIEDVLAARVTPEMVKSKRFSAKEYSLGLGALGPSVNDVMPLIGEMITIGGTMVWLPTDGNDTPDFLVPHADSEAVVIRTGFNASIAGEFNEYVEFESDDPAGLSMDALYRALFDLAKQRRPDYRGVIAIALRGEVSEVYGSGVTRSPIAAHAPENGKWITDPSNFPSWFEFDQEPRHRNMTGLICGVGVDLDADLSGFNQECLQATFYINPANSGGMREMLHNHGVFFSSRPFGEKPWNLEGEIARVVEEGDFVDMRHLLDKTAITRAVIGVVYVQDFSPDSEGK